MVKPPTGINSRWKQTSKVGGVSQCLSSVLSLWKFFLLVQRLSSLLLPARSPCLMRGCGRWPSLVRCRFSSFQRNNAKSWVRSPIRSANIGCAKPVACQNISGSCLSITGLPRYFFYFKLGLFLNVATWGLGAKCKIWIWLVHWENWSSATWVQLVSLLFSTQNPYVLS